MNDLEKIAQRDEWEGLLKRGDCTLDAALYMCMKSGAPFTEYLIGRYEAAIHAYQYGDVKDLAEPFGIAMGKREKNSMERETLVSHVRFHVDAFHGQGFPKQDPTYYDPTAFHKAGELLNKSPSQIFAIYYER